MHRACPGPANVRPGQTRSGGGERVLEPQAALVIPPPDWEHWFELLGATEFVLDRLRLWDLIPAAHAARSLNTSPTCRAKDQRLVEDLRRSGG